MLALFQGTQLNLFERFLTQALSGIDSTSITSGMQNVAYVVLLVGFLWQVYQSALHGGDVRGLGTSLIKYVATAFVIMNYSAVFSTVNQGFVNAGNWIGNASGAGNLFDNWKNDIQTQFNQDASQQLWSLISGGLPGLIDGLLDHRRLHPLPGSHSDLRILLHFLRLGLIHLRPHRDCAPSAPCRQPYRQVLHRECLHLECLADLVRRFRGSFERRTDGTSRSDAESE